LHDGRRTCAVMLGGVGCESLAEFNCFRDQRFVIGGGR
jgi:hypothetical protein